VHALARAAGHRTLELQALASRSGLRMQIGDARGAVSDAWRAARQQRRLGDRHGERASALNLAIGLIGLERLRQALTVLDAHFADADRADDLAAIAVCVRAEVWLRAGETCRGLAVLACLSPEALTLPTRLHHGLLEAWALQAEGRADEAIACWRALRALTPADRGVGVALRARVLSCVVVPAAEARAELDALVIRAEAAGAVAAEGIARLRRAAWALRDERPADAHADLRWLLRRRPALRHLYLPMAELEAFALRLSPDPSRRRAALAWRDAEVLPHLPPGSRAAWSSCPAWAELGGGIVPDVPGTRTYSRSRLA
jgi:tetratricopeptide (TPR) repeat protein